MKNLLRNRIFIATFLLTYFSFFAITMWLFEFRSHDVATTTNYGFPFTYFRSTCFGGNYIWQGFAGNIVFSLGMSFVAGSLFSSIKTKLSSPEFRSKWYLNK